MLFQLPTFLAFALLFGLGLALCPKRMVGPFVLVASLVFYGWWSPPHIIVIVAFILGSWAGLRWRRRRPDALTLLVVVALLPLAVFKYGDFLLGLIASATGAGVPYLGLGLPLGISFVTFSVISLLVDSRRADQQATGVLNVGLYICFFPHLIAGPILRPHQIMPQLATIRLDWRAMPANLVLFAVGMMKKVLIADPLAAIADPIFAQPVGRSAGDCALALLCFPIQLYCDFSAYSDMAIALAAMLGVSFPHNFHSPYGSASLSEIWRRWHMTLSFWLRDYVFKPLHARWHRRSRYLALVVTMMVSGLWHGAGTTFLLWGLAQGLIMAIENASGYAGFANRARGPTRAACVAATFLLWTVLSIVFRAATAHDAATLLLGVFGAQWTVTTAQWPLALALIAITLAAHRWDRVDTIRAVAARLPAAFGLPVTLILILACAMIAAGRPQSFYYFVF